MTMVVSSGVAKILMRDQVRCHATPVSSSEQTPEPGGLLESQARRIHFRLHV